jgi:hypothetical protein
MTVRDVNLASALGDQRVTLEFEVPPVDVQELLALADHRLVAMLDGHTARR